MIIRQIKTRWGTCNREAGRIWLNFELAKKPPSCLELIVVLELVHLLHYHHDDAYTYEMDRHLPQWRLSREVVGSGTGAVTGR